jgi:hypothetical protein
MLDNMFEEYLNEDLISKRKRSTLNITRSLSYNNYELSENKT